MPLTVPPLGPTQFRWWDRLRRIPRVAFVIGGAVVVPLLTVAIHGMVSIMLGEIASMTRLMLIIGILVPLVAAAFLATAWYMEARYRRALGLLCPGCGYSLTGLAGDRCPECGRGLSLA